MWVSRQNNMHGQIIRQNVGKKQGGNAYESKNETKQPAQYAYCAGNVAGNALCHEPDGVCGRAGHQHYKLHRRQQRHRLELCKKHQDLDPEWLQRWLYPRLRIKYAQPGA